LRQGEVEKEVKLSEKLFGMSMKEQTYAKQLDTGVAALK